MIKFYHKVDTNDGDRDWDLPPIHKILADPKDTY